MDEETRCKYLLAVAWLKRALGKTSHSGFNGCLGEAEHYLKMINSMEAEMLLDLLEGASLHVMEPVEQAIDSIERLVPGATYTYGDMPSIERLEYDCRQWV